MSQKLYKVTLRGQHKTEYDGRNNYISYVVADNPTDAESMMVSELKHKHIDFDEDLTLVSIEFIAAVGKNHESRFRLYLPNEECNCVCSRCEDEEYVDVTNSGEKLFTLKEINDAYHTLSFFFIPGGMVGLYQLMDTLFEELGSRDQKVYTVSDLEKSFNIVFDEKKGTSNENYMNCFKFVVESIKLILK